jgi:hypothetical protein
MREYLFGHVLDSVVREQSRQFFVAWLFRGARHDGPNEASGDAGGWLRRIHGAAAVRAQCRHEFHRECRLASSVWPFHDHE